MQSLATRVFLGILLLVTLSCTAATKASTPVIPGLRVSDVKTSDGEPLTPRNTQHNEDGDDGEGDGENIEMEPDPVAPAEDDAGSASNEDMDDSGSAGEAEEEPEPLDDGESGIEVYEDDEEFAF